MFAEARSIESGDKKRTIMMAVPRALTIISSESNDNCRRKSGRWWDTNACFDNVNQNTFKPPLDGALLLLIIIVVVVVTFSINNMSGLKSGIEGSESDNESKRINDSNWNWWCDSQSSSFSVSIRARVDVQRIWCFISAPFIHEKCYADSSSFSELFFCVTKSR